MSKYPELSEFSLAFADAYRGFMREYRITGLELTEKLGRALGYVSERVNGKRALDTEDVDALAMLAGEGWTGRTLMIELARRARVATEGHASAFPANVTRMDDHRHDGLVDERAVASEYSEDRGEDDGYDA